jgi:hypothetical protein
MYAFSDLNLLLFTDRFLPPLLMIGAMFIGILVSMAKADGGMFYRCTLGLVPPIITLAGWCGLANLSLLLVASGMVSVYFVARQVAQPSVTPYLKTATILGLATYTSLVLAFGLDLLDTSVIGALPPAGTASIFYVAGMALGAAATLAYLAYAIAAIDRNVHYHRAAQTPHGQALLRQQQARP